MSDPPQGEGASSSEMWLPQAEIGKCAAEEMMIRPGGEAAERLEKDSSEGVVVPGKTDNHCEEPPPSPRSNSDDADASSSVLVRRIRRSLNESTAPRHEVVIVSGGEKVCANCDAGCALYDASRGVWKVRYRPLPPQQQQPSTTPSPSPSLSTCPPEEAKAFPADAHVWLVAEIKPVNDDAVDGAKADEDPPLPPAAMVKNVLKRMELCNMICRNRDEARNTNQTGIAQDFSTVRLRQGETVSLAPILESVSPSEFSAAPVILSQSLTPHQLSNNEWSVVFLNEQSNGADASPDIPALRSFVSECLVSDDESSMSRDKASDDNSTSIVSVETPHHNPSRMSDGFASVSSLGDVSSHTADTNIGTDEESRLTTDDIPKAPPPLEVSDAADSGKQPPKKRKRGRTQKEIEILKEDYRVAAPDRNIVQLFASEFSASGVDVNSQGRSKRKIKQVVRFNASPHSYSLEKKKMAAAGKTGSGFLCPQCSFHCSYDSRVCRNCSLPCRYVAGTGVVVERERDEAGKDPPPDIKGDLNFDKQEDGAGGEPSQASGITPSPAAEPAPPLAPATPTICPKVSDTPPSSAGKGAKRRNGIDSLECGVCEACFQIFSSGYLQTHRKRIHDLPLDAFGCPYCGQRLSSAHRREIHIQKKHPGEIWKLSDEELSRTKILPYLCHLCDSPPFNLQGLRNHLRSHDVLRSTEVYHLIRCVCPFCPAGPNDELVTFETADLLDEHVQEMHEGCNIIGMRLPPSARSGAKRIKREPIPKKEEASTIAHKANVLESSEDSSSSSEDEAWMPLSHHGAVSQVKDLDKDLCTENVSLESAFDIVSSRLDKVQRQMSRLKKSDADSRYESEYLAEHRLYLRGLRERHGKADREKLEKEKYKAEVEERLLRWKYENRGKSKMTEAEKEEKAILTRPIHFKQRESRRLASDKGCVLDDCFLCSGEYAKWIITDEEMKKANFDVLKAIPLPLHQESEKIMNPSYREISSDCMYDSDEDEAEDAKGQKNTGQDLTTREKLLTRSAEKWKLASEEARRLNEAKTSLEFIKRYNEGLLQPFRLKRGW